MKKIMALCLAFSMLLVMAGCAKSSGEPGAPEYTDKPGEPGYSENTTSKDSMADIAPTTPNITGGYVPGAEEKLIYKGELTIETLEYDKSLETLNQLLSQAGGFVENSAYNNSGGYRTDGTSYAGNRSATLTLRVPSSQFQLFFNNMNTVGAVRNSNSQVQNITAEYQDTSLRLQSLQVQHERMIEMLKKAEKVEDMITIEGQLSQLRWQMDSLQSQMKNWDTSVNFSTVQLYISEVTQYSPQQNDHFFARLWRTVKNTLSGYVEAAEGLLFGFITILPLLLTVLVIWLVVRKPIRTIRRRIQDKEEKNTQIEPPQDDKKE